MRPVKWPWPEINFKKNYDFSGKSLILLPTPKNTLQTVSFLKLTAEA